MRESFVIVNSQLEWVDQLEAVQRACFPTLAADEIITAAHYAAHIQRFPEGQFAVIEQTTGHVVACSTDFRTAIDFTHFDHRYIDAVGHNWLSHHNPAGDWLYGADIGVLPAYRQRGLASRLYEARRALVRSLGLKGQVAGGLLRGYGAYKATMPVEAYVAKVVAGAIFDPTLSVQLQCGFTIHGIMQHYVDDPTCDGKAAFIVWHNPDYRVTER